MRGNAVFPMLTQGGTSDGLAPFSEPGDSCRSRFRGRCNKRSISWVSIPTIHRYRRIAWSVRRGCGSATWAGPIACSTAGKTRPWCSAMWADIG